jgi:hypothetical protein
MEVGGSVALQPLRSLLENDFKAPLNETRERALQDWEESSKAARRAFYTTVIMSSCVFAFGLIVSALALWQVIFRDKADQLLGPGVTFALGLSAMIGAFYGGPLRNVHNSVRRFTDANLALITFIHRLQFVGALVATEYAHGRLDYKGVGDAGAMIAAAADDAHMGMADDPDLKQPESPNPPVV